MTIDFDSEETYKDYLTTLANIHNELTRQVLQNILFILDFEESDKEKVKLIKNELGFLKRQKEKAN